MIIFNSTKVLIILINLIEKYKIPIIAVGMGEKESDLQPFKADYFSKALLGF